MDEDRRDFKYIIIGAGALGSAVAYWLSRTGNGSDTLLLEQYKLGHSYGASEDHSRIIRHFYNSSDYTRLTPSMFDAWRQVESASGIPLLCFSGALALAESGTLGESDLEAYASAMDAAELPFEALNSVDVTDRWPEWNIDRSTKALFHNEAGILNIRRANAVHRALAIARQTTVMEETVVQSIEPIKDYISVHTDHGRVLRADRVIVCAASWSGPLLSSAGVHLPITLSQEQVSYFTSTNIRRFGPDRWPVWLWHGEDIYYGFPAYGEAATKAAVERTDRVVTQETRAWEPDPAETSVVQAFLTERLPGAVGPELYSKTCVYDMLPDHNFLLDSTPDDDRLLVAVGSGHAAKFASLIGKIMSDLATTGATAYPIDPFRFNRPALSDPSYTPPLRIP